MNTTIIIAAAIGAILYFAFEFKTRATSTFSFGTWFKDNWYNVIITALCLYAYVSYVHPEMQKAEAFLVGFGINKITDYFSDLFQKNKK